MGQVNEHRSVAEPGTIFETRTRFGDIPVDTAAHCRLLSRVRKDDGHWRVASPACIYEQDTLRPVDPWVQVPLDPVVLRRFRPSYRFLGYNVHLLGRTINGELPGDDRPDLVDALCVEAHVGAMRRYAQK